MCGIAGAVFFDGTPSAVDATRVVEAMTAALAHRGPDGRGVVACPSLVPAEAGCAPSAVFGQRRLAIIDLTERAAQPMSSEHAAVTVTYNGEIYNFKALRAELEACGRRFRSASDTEVLLQGYEQWGPQVVERLRGMFAFAIWDGRTDTLVIARDRLGIKPLYMHRSPDCVLFASEVRALLASGLVRRQLDRQTLDQYLAYQTTPSPRTLVKDVEMVLPGHLVVMTKGRVEQRPYWDLLTCGAAAARQPSHADEVQRHVAYLLSDAAASHLISDVPVGIFLSGGIDSSAVAALVRQSGVTPHTFAVTCPGTAFDEAPYAAAAARACGAIHTEIALTERDLLHQVRAALAEVDHPSGDGMNTFIVSAAVRQAGIKVALSGLGGDEFFGGYPSFGRIARMSKYAGAWRRSPASVRRVAGAALRTVGRRSATSAKAAALVETDGSLSQTFPILRQVFSRDQRRELLTDDPAMPDGASDPYVALLDEAATRHPELDTMALVSYAEARTYMHDVLLRDTDQMSMRHGLEVRVPLLDHRLVEYLMGLPESIKRPGQGPKPLLVQALGTMLPSVCVDRPKQGFELPFETWMGGALRDFCQHHLGHDGLPKLGLFQPAGVQAVWRSFLTRDGRVSWSRPWTLVALSAWIERNRIAP